MAECTAWLLSALVCISDFKMRSRRFRNGPNSEVTVLAHRDVPLRGSLIVLMNAAQVVNAELICSWLVINETRGVHQVF
jgi:hypothetical protein